MARTISARSAAQTGIAPLGPLAVAMTPDGLAVRALPRCVYLVCATVPFAGLLDLVTTLAGPSGPLRRATDPAPASEWTPMVLPAGFDRLATIDAAEALRRMAAAIELRAQQSPGRVLPYLRTAVAAARGTAAANSPAAGTTARPSAAAPGSALRQWASAARASSEYRSTDYGAAQATGAPDVPRAGDSPRAWAPRLPDSGEEWLELTYAQAVHATEVRVIQSFRPGAIARVDLIDESGAAKTVWAGPDRTVYEANTIGVFAATFPATARAVARVRVVLDTKRVAQWNEIDAVELVGIRP